MPRRRRLACAALALASAALSEPEHALADRRASVVVDLRDAQEVHVEGAVESIPGGLRFSCDSPASAMGSAEKHY